MPELSARGNLMPESPIRKLVPYAEAAKKTGPDCVSSEYRTARYRNTGDCPSKD